MTILQLFGPTHRDDGQPFYAHKWLSRLPDTTVIRVPLTMPPEQWPDHDAVLFVDFGHDALGIPDPVIPKGKRSVCWLSDTHFSEVTRANRFRWAEAFDVAAFVHQDAAQEYEANHRQQTVSWLPVAADHELYTPPPIPICTRWDVCFVGHVGDPHRDEYLERVFEAVPNFTWRNVYFQEACQVYHQSRVVFNVSLRGDLNMRTFEALAAGGGVLVTDRQQGMDDLGIRDGNHCWLYHTGEGAVKAVQAALAVESDGGAMAQRGLAWVKAGHTYEHRARVLRDML